MIREVGAPRVQTYSKATGRGMSKNTEGFAWPFPVREALDTVYDPARRLWVKPGNPPRLKTRIKALVGLS